MYLQKYPKMLKERIEHGIASAQANIKYFRVLDHLEEAYMMPKYDYFTQVSEVVEILDTEQSGSYGLAKIACFQTYIKDHFVHRNLSTSETSVK